MGSVSFHPFPSNDGGNAIEINQSLPMDGWLFTTVLYLPSFLPSFLPFRGHRGEDWKIANQDYTYTRCGFLFRLAGCEPDFLREIRYELGATRLNRIRAVLMHASLTLEIDEVRS